MSKASTVKIVFKEEHYRLNRSLVLVDISIFFATHELLRAKDRSPFKGGVVGALSQGWERHMRLMPEKPLYLATGHKDFSEGIE